MSKDIFPTKPFIVGNLCQRAADAAEIGNVSGSLDPGTSHSSIEHLWRNHKELFADSDQAVQILRETLGYEKLPGSGRLKKSKRKQEIPK